MVRSQSRSVREIKNPAARAQSGEVLGVTRCSPAADCGVDVASCAAQSSPRGHATMNADWGCYWHLGGRGPGVPLTLPPCQAEGDATRGSRQLLGRVGDSDLVERDLAGVQNVAFGEKTQLGTRTWGPGLFLHPLHPGGSVASAGGGRGGLFFSRFFFFHLKNISLLVTCARYLASQGAERLRSPRGAKPEPRPCFQGRPASALGLQGDRSRAHLHRRFQPLRPEMPPRLPERRPPAPHEGAHNTCFLMKQRI